MLVVETSLRPLCTGTADWVLMRGVGRRADPEFVLEALDGHVCALVWSPGSTTRLSSVPGSVTDNIRAVTDSIRAVTDNIRAKEGVLELPTLHRLDLIHHTRPC